MLSFKWKGFTLIELVIVIIISGIFTGFLTIALANILRSHFSQYRLADIAGQSNLAINRMVSELRMIRANGSTDDFDPQADQIDFIDASGNTVSYLYNATNLERNGVILAENVTGLSFDYFDGNGDPAAAVTDIRYIQVNLNFTLDDQNLAVSQLVYLENSD